MYKGIDVSKWQGKIDWAKVKKDGIQFAMIRSSYGWGKDQQDRYFEENYKGAKSVGIPVGCYHYSYAHTVEEAKAQANEIGYPCVGRPAFTLGGTGGGFVDNDEQLEEIALTGIQVSPTGQLLIEKSVFGYKEIEFEVMRDKTGLAIAICDMENIDPVGVHTGDSAVVAPILTLDDETRSMLKNAALDIIRALKIEGGCNVQFALNPNSKEYYVIEVNPRVSRSSALASKATGYPIAKVATKIAIGYTLDEIKNADAAKEAVLKSRVLLQKNRIVYDFLQNFVIWAKF